MRSKGAWVQGYNAQAAITEDGVAVAGAVTNQVSDVASLHPLINQAQQLISNTDGGGERIDTVVADAGYWSEANITINSDHPNSPQLLIPPKDFNYRTGENPGVRPPEDASPAEKMRYQLATPEGSRLYAKRAAQAEGPFGHLKTRFGFTRFSRRGLTAVDSEWQFILAVRNLIKLHQTISTATA